MPKQRWLVVAGMRLWLALASAVLVAAIAWPASRASAQAIARANGLVAERYGADWCGTTAKIIIRGAQKAKIELADAPVQQLLAAARIGITVDCPQAQQILVFADGPSGPVPLATASAARNWNFVAAARREPPLAKQNAAAAPWSYDNLLKCGSIARTDWLINNLSDREDKNFGEQLMKASARMMLAFRKVSRMSQAQSDEFFMSYTEKRAAYYWKHEDERRVDERWCLNNGFLPLSVR